MILEKTCICCPAGCRLHLEISEDGERIVVSGNRCPRGEQYGITEVKDPRRVVTAAAPPALPDGPYVPVRSTEGVPLKWIPELLLEIYALRVSPPVHAGDVLIRDYRGSGIDIIASESFDS